MAYEESGHLVWGIHNLSKLKHEYDINMDILPKFSTVANREKDWYAKSNSLLCVFVRCFCSNKFGNATNKNTPLLRGIHWLWRRVRDSNSRYTFGVYTLSRRAP